MALALVVAACGGGTTTSSQTDAPAQDSVAPPTDAPAPDETNEAPESSDAPAPTEASDATDVSEASVPPTDSTAAVAAQLVATAAGITVDDVPVPADASMPINVGQRIALGDGSTGTLTLGTIEFELFKKTNLQITSADPTVVSASLVSGHLRVVSSSDAARLELTTPTAELTTLTAPYEFSFCQAGAALHCLGLEIGEVEVASAGVVSRYAAGFSGSIVTEFATADDAPGPEICIDQQEYRTWLDGAQTGTDTRALKQLVTEWPPCSAGQAVFWDNFCTDPATKGWDQRNDEFFLGHAEECGYRVGVDIPANGIVSGNPGGSATPAWVETQVSIVDPTEQPSGFRYGLAFGSPEAGFVVLAVEPAPQAGGPSLRFCVQRLTELPSPQLASCVGGLLEGQLPVPSLTSTLNLSAVDGGVDVSLNGIVIGRADTPMPVGRAWFFLVTTDASRAAVEFHRLAFTTK